MPVSNSQLPNLSVAIRPLKAQTDRKVVQLPKSALQAAIGKDIESFKPREAPVRSVAMSIPGKTQDAWDLDHDGEIDSIGYSTNGRLTYLNLVEGQKSFTLWAHESEKIHMVTYEVTTGPERKYVETLIDNDHDGNVASKNDRLYRFHMNTGGGESNLGSAYFRVK